MKSRIAAWKPAVSCHPLRRQALQGLVQLPLLLPSTAPATSVVAYGLRAPGFDPLFGWGGLLSFGRAALRCW